MNWYGKSPLEMHCPHCGGYGAHPVVRTDPKWYYYGDETTELFKRIAGRNISFRKRAKKCIKCNRQFVTVELGMIFLRGLIKEVQRLDGQVSELRGSLDAAERRTAQLEAERKATHVAIRKASKLLNRQLPERRKKKPKDGA